MPFLSFGGNSGPLCAPRNGGRDRHVARIPCGTYRSWPDAVGTPIAVQQKLMRHADIRSTMNVYGDVVTDEMAQAHSKLVRLALATSN